MKYTQEDESRGKTIKVGVGSISSLSSLIEKYKNVSDKELKKIYRPFRDKLIDQFYKRINDERIADGLKPAKFMAIRMRIYLLTDDELNVLYHQCLEARNFSRFFYWATDPKNAKEVKKE